LCFLFEPLAPFLAVVLCCDMVFVPAAAACIGDDDDGV
jgi:hypothetical protein